MNRKSIISFALIFLFSAPLSMACIGPDIVEYPHILSIRLLSLNNNEARNQFSLLIQANLAKIGIKVDILESTTLENIAPRTWDYPLIDYDYIPTYAEGGYDGLFIGYSWDLDWDPGGMYTSGCMLSRQNYYQYSNPAFDAKLTQYLTEYNESTRNGFLKELDGMLYEDLPAICIVYPKTMIAVKEGITGIDGMLLSLAKSRAENWDDSNDQIIKLAIPEMMIETNTFVKTSFYKNKWMNSVYGSLLKRGQYHHNWEPIIANNYTISLDKKNYTVFLDPNAKFSDGNPVLAEDIKYSYELYMTPSVGSSEYSYLTTYLNSNDSIEIVDTHTLNFNLSMPFVFAENLLSLGIIDKSDVEPAISTYGYSIFNEEPLSGNVQDALVKSCGPFILENYTSTNTTITSNPYWNNLTVSGGVQPNLIEISFEYYKDHDNIFYELLESDEIDIIDPDFEISPPISYDLSGFYGIIVNRLKHEELSLNMKHPVFGTGELTPVGTPAAAKEVRKAISHAIPRNQIVDAIYEGLAIPGASPIHSFYTGLFDSLDPYVYDLDLARDLMGYRPITIPCGTTTTTPIGVLPILISLVGLACYSLNKKLLKKISG